VTILVVIETDEASSFLKMMARDMKDSSNAVCITATAGAYTRPATCTRANGKEI